MSRMNIRVRSVVAMLLALFICGCDSHKNDIRFIRFEQVLFNTPAPQLATTLAANSADYNTPLLNIDPSDSRYMAMLGDFVSDTAMRYIYHVTGSMSWAMHCKGLAGHSTTASTRWLRATSKTTSDVCSAPTTS